jgi:hypothetical protein
MLEYFPKYRQCNSPKKNDYIQHFIKARFLVGSRGIWQQSDKKIQQK